MIENSNSNRLNVLITRPMKKAQELSNLLSAGNISCVVQPLFDYQAFADYETSKNLLTNENIIIFVSASSVEYANKIFDSKLWKYRHILAVGKATGLALEGIGIQNVIQPEQENSEGLLKLTVLKKKFNGDNITIVRGDSGREHLATQLTKQGATVKYLESYQRVWRTFSEDIGNQWFNQQINCIVITSNDILEKIMSLLLTQNNKQNNTPFTKHWRDQCLWVVVSQRIANTAKHFGLTRVIISNGASKSAITTTIQQLENK